MCAGFHLEGDMKRAQLGCMLIFSLGVAAMAQQPAAPSANPTPTSIVEQNTQTGLPADGQTGWMREVTESRLLRDGVEIRSGRTLMRVTALRDDILRIHAAVTGGQLPLTEDGSWALLPEVRNKAI